MTESGFYAQKSFRPGGLAMVLAMHAAAFAGLLLVKTTVDRIRDEPTDLINIITPPPPPEVPPEPVRELPRTQPTVIETVRPIIDLPLERPITRDPPLPPLPPTNNPVGERVELARVERPPPPPVRVEAQVDPRFARDLQPPYPAREESAQRDGVVRVRVTIGADGRVKAIERLSATSDAFWQSTQRHALARWRFRPATLDGRPVESSKQMNVYFRIEA